MNKKPPYDAKLDDTLVSIFSRKRTGRKKTKETEKCALVIYNSVH